MFAIQQHCPVLEKYTPQNERPTDGVWVTLIKFETREDAVKVMERKYHDNRPRTERVAEVA
jgi:hypothetical protein